jgi:RNA ligase (TIGR02306 family)
MKEIKSVEIVEITDKQTIYKNGEPANAIEVVHFKYDDGSPCGYHLISQKDLYEVGDKACFIQPDYCLSDISLFDSFTKPNGEPKKSKLGKNARIRAVKFNFNFDNSSDPIYSFGILLPLTEVEEYLHTKIDKVSDLSEVLGITKYEEPESGSSGMVAGDFPSFIYKTDETNWNNLIGRVKECIEDGEEFGLTLKRDGSSITLFFKKNAENEFYHGICSRSQEKKLDQSYVSLYVDHLGSEFHKYIHPETKEKGWFNDDSRTFITDEWAKENLTPKTVEVRDSWVDVANDKGYVSKLVEYCKKYDVELAFRGELIGEGLKGSGNKLNPDSKLKQTIILFGVDSLDSGFSVRNHYGQFHNLETVGMETGLPYTESVWIKPTSIEELESACKEIFTKEESAGRVIEGIVIRTKNNNRISCKYMNPYYDQHK